MKQRKAEETYAQCSTRLGRSPQVPHTITQATAAMSRCCGAMISHAVQRRKPWSVGALTIRTHWTIPQQHSVKVWIPTLFVPFQIPLFLTTHQRWARSGAQFGNWGMDALLGRTEFNRNCSSMWRSQSLPLFTLFAHVWKSGLSPAEWREGIIVSLYKGKGPRNNCGSYRPISLLSVPGKVFANVLLARLRPLLTARRRPQQSGFTPGRSTIDAILALRLLSGIIVSLYKGKGPRNNWIPTLLVPFQILPFLTTHHSVPSTHHSRQWFLHQEFYQPLNVAYIDIKAEFNVTSLTPGILTPLILGLN